MPINIKTFTPVSIQTYEGVPDGMNLALPGQEIQDTEAMYLQDILLDYPGLVRRRGPVQAASGFPVFTTYKTSGIATSLDPNGNTRLAVLRGDTSNAFAALLSSDFTSISTDFALPGSLPTAPTANPYRVVDAKAALNKGTWIGTTSNYGSNGPVQNLGLWIGANKPDYATGTLTVARGATAVTGSGTAWSTHVVPGMFMFYSTDDGYTLAYGGIVTAVVSDTSITLGDVALYPATAKAYNFTSIRGFAPRVVKGRVTCATGSTTVTGANTKFKSQNMSSGTWNMYRASDLTWIGKVASVTNDFSITLASNAAIALNNERYIAYQADADMNISTQSVANKKVGFLNATYSGLQWYGNNGQSLALTSRVYFSDPSDPEAVDMDLFAGDYINISSTVGVNGPLKALSPAYNALLCFKDNEVFGIFGTSSSTFNVKKVEDDGVFSGMSVQSYGGGVIWAGRQGIHFYNGIQATNITQPKLGDFYKNMIRNLSPDTYRMWSMIARDHYFLHIEQVQPNVPVIKGSTSVTPTNMTIVVNMISQAITVWTNTCIRGSVVMPVASGFESLFVVNDATQGYVCSSKDLFDVDGVNDSITCDAATAAGPDFYFESKKFSEGDSMHKKLFKQLAMNYLVQGDKLNLDTVMGLNQIGQTSTSSFPPTVYTWDSLAITFGTWDNLKNNIPTWDQVILSVFVPARIKFLKRTQNLSIRIWQNSTACTRVRLGPFQVGYKWMRTGRI